MLRVKQAHEVPVTIDPGKLLISDIPRTVDEEFLLLFVESRLDMKATDFFTLTFCPPKALLTFVYNHTEKGASRTRDCAIVDCIP